jgi:hypothetical protein
MVQAVQIVQTVEIKTPADEQWFHVQSDRDELSWLVAHSWPTVEHKGLKSAFSL